MPSSISWLDYSEEERRKAVNLIAQLEEKGAVDELGVGSIRDAFSELLAPGVSILQTRARYFLFIPWLYLELERREVSTHGVASLARRAETNLIFSLLRSRDHKGLIGKEAQKALKQLPSSIYWQGLLRWGICRLQVGRDAYHHGFDDLRRSRRAIDPYGGDGSDATGPPTAWHEGIPPAPGNFPDNANFRLRREEAAYLREKLMTHCRGSMLALLAENAEPWDKVALPWEHPNAADLGPKIAEELEHARNFSELIGGAVRLYNIMLAEGADKNGGRRDPLEKHGAQFELWAARTTARMDVYRHWDRERFWQIAHGSGTRIPTMTRTFVDAWLDCALASANPTRLMKDRSVRNLIVNRERMLKKKLAKIGNPRALELWKGDSGTRPMGYRWPVTQQHLGDIMAGLGRS